MSRRALGLLLGLLAAEALAGDAVKVGLNAKGFVGKEFPSVEIQIQEPIAGFELLLERNDGKKLDIKGGGEPGVTRTIDLFQSEGKATWTGELRVNFPRRNDKSSMPLSFETELVGPLKLTVKPEDVELAGRKVTFTATRPLTKVHLRVAMDTGREVADRDIRMQKEPGGTPLTVEWPEAPGQVLELELRVYDVDGFFAGVELTPWRLDIPHEEVAFAPGRWEIQAAEKPKLDESYARIAEALKKHEKLSAVKLYVIGHTDTVGPAEKNRALSLNRAMSLGAYLRGKGLRVPVLCEGFGEDALKVPTPDETAEPGNHRVEYILSIENPAEKGAPAALNWRRL